MRGRNNLLRNALAANNNALNAVNPAVIEQFNLGNLHPRNIPAALLQQHGLFAAAHVPVAVAPTLVTIPTRAQQL